jgi:hypothetical protein
MSSLHGNDIVNTLYGFFILVACILLRYVYIYLSNIPAIATESLLVKVTPINSLRIFQKYTLYGIKQVIHCSATNKHATID